MGRDFSVFAWDVFNFVKFLRLMSILGSMSSSCKTIYLARHAKSAWDTDAASDFDRPLSNRGQQDVVRVGKKFAELGWKPDKIISSPALRARQTCEVLCENIGISADRIIWNDDIYAAYTVSLLHLLSQQPEALESVMLVGHNPSMEELLVHLCGDVVTDEFR